MRLYLSSYKFGDHSEKLSELADKNKKAAVIMNAVDFGDEERKHQGLFRQIEELKKLGFNAEELDLRNYFNNTEKLREYLKNIGLVWIHGGNAFILQRAFEQSGFGILIKKFLEQDKLVYAGFSAAICVIAPTLHGAELVDDQNIVPEGYKKDFNWDGLNLIPYNVAVHYKSDHPESADIDKEVAYYEEHNLPYKTLRDGEIIIINK